MYKPRNMNFRVYDNRKKASSEWFDSMTERRSRRPKDRVGFTMERLHDK
jgi:hypothetical protein